MTERWTEADIPDQTGRVALITGANSGIGFEAARALAQRGATVVLGCRNRDKGAAAVERIRALDPTGTADILEIDLADLDSVAGAAARFQDGHTRLDVLVNNAGVMATPHQTTQQGFELQFGVNHLGAFALTGRLIETVVATSGSRVVAISSQGHRPGSIQFDDLQSERNYQPWRAYFQSKLANLLFTFELQRRFLAANLDAIAVAAHPGGARTNLGHENPGGIVNTVAMSMRPVIERAFLQSAAMGALPTLRAATDPTVVGGNYFGPHGFMEQRGYPKLVGTTKRAVDDAVARRLWDTSVELTGVGYEALDVGRRPRDAM